jgi:hypothetical protein
VDESVGSAAFGLNEAEAFGLVEKFDCACRHLTIPSYAGSERRILIARSSDKEGKRSRKAPVPVRLRPIAAASIAYAAGGT